MTTPSIGRAAAGSCFGLAAIHRAVIPGVALSSVTPQLVTPGFGAIPGVSFAPQIIFDTCFRAFLGVFEPAFWAFETKEAGGGGVEVGEARRDMPNPYQVLAVRFSQS